MSIANLLDQLSTERLALEDAREQAQRHIPQDIRDWITAAEQRIACLEAEVKSKAKYIPEAQAHTLVGQHLQLVWSVRKAWDDSELQALASKYGVSPAELDGCKVSKGGWSIRARGQK